MSGLMWLAVLLLILAVGLLGYAAAKFGMAMAAGPKHTHRGVQVQRAGANLYLTCSCGARRTMQAGALYGPVAVGWPTIESGWVKP